MYWLKTLFSNGYIIQLFFLFFFFSLAHAQLKGPEYDVWKGDCWMEWIKGDEWEGKQIKKCSLELKTRYDYTESLCDPLLKSLNLEPEGHDLDKNMGYETNRERVCFYPYYNFAPNVITLKFTQEQEGFRLTVVGSEPKLFEEYKSRGREMAWRIRMRDLSNLSKHLEIPVYAKVGIRVDKNEPLYSDMCKLNWCYFDPSYTASSLDQFKSGESATVRLYANGSSDDPKPFEKKVPLQGFVDAFKEAFSQENDIETRKKPSSNKCTSEQIEKMTNIGFSKEEITQLCGEAKKPSP